jgi:hypothetical protein
MRRHPIPEAEVLGLDAMQRCGEQTSVHAADALEAATARGLWMAD